MSFPIDIFGVCYGIDIEKQYDRDRVVTKMNIIEIESKEWEYEQPNVIFNYNFINDLIV